MLFCFKKIYRHCPSVGALLIVPQVRLGIEINMDKARTLYPHHCHSSMTMELATLSLTVSSSTPHLLPRLLLITTPSTLTNHTLIGFPLYTRLVFNCPIQLFLLSARSIHSPTIPVVSVTLVNSLPRTP